MKSAGFHLEGMLKNAGLILIFALGFYLAYTGYFEKASYFLPTYDNAMLHAGRARFIIETGSYAEKEVVFGGKTPTYHLPAYPALVAGTTILTGLDFAWAERIIGLLFSFLLPFAFYCIAKGISGDWRAGVAAAIIAMYSASLMTWATRNSPIALGNIIVPLALFFILRKELLLAALSAFVLAIDHQPSLLAFVLSAFIFVAIEFTLQQWDHLSKKRGLSIHTLLADLTGPSLAAGVFSGLFSFILYMIWHIRQAGISCIDFKCLPQAAAREFGKSIDLAEYFSKNPQFLAIGGILLIPFSTKIDSRSKLMAFSWLAANTLLVKNDLIGIGTFTERFLTYFDGVTAVFGGMAIALILSYAWGDFKQ